MDSTVNENKNTYAFDVDIASSNETVKQNRYFAPTDSSKNGSLNDTPPDKLLNKPQKRNTK